ncbi:zinc-dependent metalloprotease family protein [Planctomicrobium piriforme]|uniref:Metallo-peptidase family M12B Reprolysin-like n=1 Tax=Planctomicrobium piriforme TaxID=1576369 RepID=A0A1I3F0B1_9PLAN|nr:zinc-dependent metalloprotease family protein [Planctomicrobium piriforme]SFI04251.1 hypothetical protein SAMN05421753_1053 [Planctomicrobium piriforme]
MKQTSNWLVRRFSQLLVTSRPSARRNRQKFSASLELFEARVLLSSTTAATAESLLQIDPIPLKQGSESTTALDTAAAGVSYYPLTSIPVLNSLPGAAVSIYLDFDGHFEADWGGGYTNLTTPVFSIDADQTTFTDAELAVMNSVWARVAEDYAPFKINVTTVQPASFADGVSVRVAIGGQYTDWLGSSAGGVAFLGSFTDSNYVNTCYVFSTSQGNDIIGIAEAASHEAGHTFGLEHQSLYDSAGRKLQEYNPGDEDWAPIMGVGYYSIRTTWYDGPNSESSTTLQNDLNVIAGLDSRYPNKIGFRNDDVGNFYANASTLTASGSALTGSGIISSLSDVDVFKFGANAGLASFTISPAAEGANLLIHAELRSSTGVLLASAQATPGSQILTLSQTLAEGSYQLVISTNDGYGSLGQYTIQGTASASRATFSGATITSTYIANYPPVYVFKSTTINWGTYGVVGGVLTVRMSNAESTDRLTVQPGGDITIFGTSVRYKGVTIGTISGGTASGALSVKFNTKATQQSALAVLRAVVYWSTSLAPTAGDRYFSLDLLDEGKVSAATASKIVKVSNKPSLQAISTTNTYAAGTAPLLFASNAVVADGNGNFAKSQLKVSIADGQAADRLTIVPNANVTLAGDTVKYQGTVIGTFTGGTGFSQLVVNFNASATQPGIQAVLRRIGFSNESVSPSLTTRSVSFTLKDGKNVSSTPVIAAVAISNIPTITNFGSNVAYSLGGTPSLLSTTATVAGGSTFQNISLTIALSIGVTGDNLSVRTGANISIAGGNLSFQGTVVASITGGLDGNPLVLTFNASAERWIVQSVLRQVIFSSTSLNTSVRGVSFQFSDATSATSDAALKSILFV